MSHHFSQQFRVQFADTDAAGIMHFTRFFQYMEQTEHAMYRELGFSVFDAEHDEDHKGSWPRINCSCDYQRPLRFEEVFEVHLTIEEIADKTVTYRFDFEREGSRLATGRFGVIYAIKSNTGGPMRAASIPDKFREKLEALTKE